MADRVGFVVACTAGQKETGLPVWVVVVLVLLGVALFAALAVLVWKRYGRRRMTPVVRYTR